MFDAEASHTCTKAEKKIVSYEMTSKYFNTQETNEEYGTNERTVKGLILWFRVLENDWSSFEHTCYADQETNQIFLLLQNHRSAAHITKIDEFKKEVI